MPKTKNQITNTFAKFEFCDLSLEFYQLLNKIPTTKIKSQTPRQFGFCFFVFCFWNFTSNLILNFILRFLMISIQHAQPDQWGFVIFKATASSNPQ